jgi:hypothetical protein
MSWHVQVHMLCSSVLHITHLLIMLALMHTHNTYCITAISPSQGNQSMYTGKQMSLRATLVIAQCRKFCRFCCWMWVWGCCTDSRNYHSVQAYTFRKCKISLWIVLAAYNLTGCCTVRHTQTVCPQLSPAHETKSAEYNYSVIHWLMSYIVITMLTDL